VLWSIDAVAVETLIVRAPGRVNLIGEHTDYNDGFVMPIAIAQCTTVRLRRRDDALIRVRSAGFAETVHIQLNGDVTPPVAGWSLYVHGVVRVLQSAGHRLTGAELAIDSSVPAGAGLSSSAALEVACAAALLRCARIDVDLTTLARLCQRAENEFVGTRCGIMDQYVVCHAQAGHALLLDCRNLTHRQLIMDFRDAHAVFVVCNSMVRHALASGEYNQRRMQCEVGVRSLATRDAAIRSLRDVTAAQLEELGQDMNVLIKRRCRHVVSENERVVAAATAVSKGSAATFGALMSASHRSLRDDYDVSCDELDLLVDIAHSIEGVLGARMTGGGFGGCTINLVRADTVARFATQISERYRTATGLQPQVFVCTPGHGVSATTQTGHHGAD
jgi:galactokinase